MTGSAMPFFRFMVHGIDPRLPGGVRGFYTTRHAFGSDREHAEKKMVTALLREFTTGRSAALWSSDPPELVVEKSWPIGLFELYAAPNHGSTFYDERG